MVMMLLVSSSGVLTDERDSKSIDGVNAGRVVRAATTVILFIGSAVASLWPTFLAPIKVGTEAPQQTSLPPGTSLR